MRLLRWVATWLLVCTCNAAPAMLQRPEFSQAAQAEAKQEWSSALSAYESIYDSTRTDDLTRAELRRKFAELRPKVPLNADESKPGVWKVRAYVFRELDFKWKDKQGTNYRAQYRYRDEEIERLRRGMQAFADRVWEFTDGNLRIQWDLKILDKPLTKLDGTDSFWPGPDACMPYFSEVQHAEFDTIMVFVKVFGDPEKDARSAEVPQMLLGGAIGVADPLTKGATYIGFNWGSGTAADEPDGEPMVHEWLHSAQWALEEHQGYPPGLMCSSDMGRREGEQGGDSCYRRRPDENTWMRFYHHIMRDHVTRKMWRQLSPNRPPTNIWLETHPLTSYVDPAQLDCPWPKMSHYKQPWRGYLETRSGYDFLQGMGVNLHIPPDTEELAIRLLSETGLKTFRIEIGWGEMNWEETKLNNEARFQRKLELCAKYNIRPTLLINAHQGVPCPVRFFERELLSPASKGQRSVRLNKVDDLVVGRSGLSGLSDYWAAETLITGVDTKSGEVTLSKPLPKDLPAGKVQLATLKYAPLHPVGSAEFDATAAGWVRHALHVCELAKSEGLKEFDVEIWNELTFGTHFLDINDYYGKDAPKVTKSQPDFLNEGGRCWELARRTVEGVKKAHPNVRVIWGFSNTTFYHCKVDKLPPGIDGQSYHPYGTGTREIKGHQERADQAPMEGFVPTYTLRMPEGWAPTFVQTECLVRHLRPDVRTQAKPPRVDKFYHYMTEHGVLPPECGVQDETNAWGLKAICATRSFCLWLNKGVDAVHYFDAYEEKPTSFGILPTNLRQLPADSRFEDVATAPMRAIRHLAVAFEGSVPLDKTDPLQFEVTALGPQGTIFEGDQSHPPLWEREALAILPFQVNRDTHAVGLYVMTRDAVKPFPAAPFRIRISGLKGRELQSTDVLTGESVLVCTKDLGADKLELSLYIGQAPVILRIGK